MKGYIISFGHFTQLLFIFALLYIPPSQSFGGRKLTALIRWKSWENAEGIKFSGEPCSETNGCRPIFFVCVEPSSCAHDDNFQCSTEWVRTMGWVYNVKPDWANFLEFSEKSTEAEIKFSNMLGLTVKVKANHIITVSSSNRLQAPIDTYRIDFSINNITLEQWQDYTACGQRSRTKWAPQSELKLQVKWHATRQPLIEGGTCDAPRIKRTMFQRYLLHYGDNAEANLRSVGYHVDSHICWDEENHCKNNGICIERRTTTGTIVRNCFCTGGFVGPICELMLKDGNYVNTTDLSP